LKLKQTPDDFQVEELTGIVPSQGPFALYRLVKRGFTTPDAIALVQKRWKIKSNRIDIGGLKDRHAATIQHFTILNGPQRKLTRGTIDVEYLGQVPEPFTSRDITANRFRILLRDVDGLAISRANQIAKSGVPNYFDDQRFGSISVGSEFVARLMVLGQYEAALKLALTAPYEFDKAPQKAEKVRLRQMWGQWRKFAETLRVGPKQQIAHFLVNQPVNFRDAVRFLHPELQGMYLAAYQSFIWNRMLSSFIRKTIANSRAIRLKLGEFPTADRLTPEQLNLLLTMKLPLPSARLPWDAKAPWAAFVKEALSDQGFTLSQMKLPGLRKPFFSRGERAAWVMPRSYSVADNSDKRQLTLTFELPRGSYATILVKQLQSG
jgi:tRNA pseudouridine13 synthase